MLGVTTVVSPRLSLSKDATRRAATALLIAASSPAFADGILPFMTAPYGVVLLFPLVVLIEGAVILRMLGGRIRTALAHSFWCNLASTFLGVVLTLLVEYLFGKQIFLWDVQGMGYGSHLPYFVVTLAISAVLYLVTLAVEASCLSRLRGELTRHRAVVVSGVMNLFTYVPLVAYGLYSAW